ncbi:hypothetical protein FFLO_02365 [Filobasidium floriforme]|uniref:Uncharacterized protein n=1 Tax=Filobasidium floriforme TaxID=5210 RepID=A0A8K0JPP7_9TREE|nr:uncharacterized protein HD553DRAFT_322227 [Filobasidium floriforme]KAG7562180.1 hypothetical protein FFLO_02365 [Filobasidium floriforme]KAH8088313.1 hypothetical protein HD553DRAFT_322227 [Filobasidium floriforme]
MEADRQQMTAALNGDDIVPVNTHMEGKHPTTAEVPPGTLKAIRQALEDRYPEHRWVIEGNGANAGLVSGAITILQMGTKYKTLEGAGKVFRGWNDRISGNYRTCHMSHYKDTLYMQRSANDLFNAVPQWAGMWLVAGIYRVRLLPANPIATDLLMVIGRKAATHFVDEGVAYPYPVYQHQFLDAHLFESRSFDNLTAFVTSPLFFEGLRPSDRQPTDLVSDVMQSSIAKSTQSVD